MNMEGTLGYKIKSYRKNNDLTLNELGEKVGVTHAYLSRVENNKVIPTDELLEKIANNLPYDDPVDTLNEFRVLAGYYNNIDEDSELYNDLKASGRLEIDKFDPEEDDDEIKRIKGLEEFAKKRNHKRIVENPYYKLNYLLETEYKVFYDLKFDYVDKLVTIEIPSDFKHELYKMINQKIIELVKNNPSLLNSIEDENTVKQYRIKERKLRNEIFENARLSMGDNRAIEFMRYVTDDTDLI